MTTQPLRLGTRASKLALTQSGHVRDAIAAAAGVEVELVHITTSGDRIQDRLLTEIGGKGLFTQEIEEALLDRRIDLAVHSLKDLPTLLPAGLAVAAIPERELAFDALVGLVGLVGLAGLSERDVSEVFLAMGAAAG